MWRNWNPCALLVGMQSSIAAVKISLAAPQRINIELPYDPAVPLLGIYLKELKAGTQTNTPMFTAALVTVAKR